MSDKEGMKRESISAKLRFEILQRDGFRCTYCGRKSPDVALHIDHIVPVAKGGKTIPDNLQASCQDCNNGKGTEDVVTEITDISDLVGKFFHTFYPKDHEHAGRIDTQGVITTALGSGYFMVQLFEWFSGSPSFYGMRLFHIAKMMRDGWSFYETDEEMRDAYQYGGRAIRD